jgi:hypothetical protein
LNRRTKPPPPPVVISKPRRSAAVRTAPRRASPDGKIRVWNADDLERQEETRFNSKSQREQIEEAITAWCARFRRPNDPEVERRIGRQGVGRDLTEASMSHMQIIEGPDPRVVLRPHAGLWAQLKRGLGMQYDAKLIVTDPKAPGRMPWWAYIKDLRRKTKD